MTNEASVYGCVTDFEILKYQREHVLIGDRPDIRDCSYLAADQITAVRICWDFIDFRRSNMFHIAAQSIDGKKVFLFRKYLHEELYRRRTAEWDVVARAKALPIDQQLTVASWVAENAGEVVDFKWWEPMRTIKRLVPNVGVADLEILLEMMPQEGAPMASAA